MKKHSIALALVSGLCANSASALDFPVTSLELTGGDFFMAGQGGSLSPAAFANMSIDGSYDGSAPAAVGSEASYAPTSIATFQFGGFGPVATYTQQTDSEGQGPFPGVTTGPLDGDTNEVVFDLRSWTAWWNGTDFNQGAGGVTATTDGAGNFTATWTATVVGGPFNGQVGNWTMAGTIGTAPLFTSTPATAAENTAGVVYTAVAEDAQSDTISYSKSGTDAALFNLNTGNGELSFVTPPDFEAPADNNADNIYEFTITATEAGNSNTATQNVSIAVTDVNEAAPVFDSVSAVSMDENNTATGYIASATDADTSQTITYTIDGGPDAASFDITGGVLSFLAAPDFEAPADSNVDNVYEVTIRATDNGSPPQFSTQDVSVTVLDVPIESLQFTSGTSVNFEENGTGVVYTAVASGPNSPITYSKNGGADQGLFSIDTNSGQLTFVTPPDFDIPGDSDGNNTYLVTINADDTVDNVDLNLVVTVTDANDQAPVFTSVTTTPSVSENQTGTGYTASATDGDTVGSVSFSIFGGADAAFFNISSGVLTFLTAPDFENPADANSDNDYEVIIEASDGVNTTQESVTVTVQDAAPTPPVITLLGTPTVEINEGDTYVDAGATALDDVDGDITANIVTDNPVPVPAIPGTYMVTYNVEDSEGDPAPEVTRTVIVTNAPQVFIQGAAIVNLQVDAPYVEFGATATDVEDGVLIGSIVTTGSVDTSTAGTYNITYSVTDSDGNSSDAVRIVHVQSNDATVGLSSLVIGGGDFAMAGATGNITAGDITPFTMNTYQGSAPAAIGTEAQYKATSIATFEFGNFGPVGVYTDSTDGVNSGLAVPSGTVNLDNGTLTLNAPSWIAYWNGSSFAQGPTEANGTPTTATGIYNTSTGAFDISWQALVVGGAFNGQTGSWHLTGTANLLQPDNDAPVIVLSGDSQVLLQKGTPYVEAGVASVTDNVDGVLDPASVAITGGVDVNNVGTYTITYSITDSSSNIGVTTRTVLVVEGNNPLITLNGPSDVEVALGDIYIDDGATALDVEDGDLTSSIITTGLSSIDTSRLGNYVVRYDVSDSDGNPAFPVLRNVNVVDLQPPVITLRGSSVIYLMQGDSYVEPGADATDNVDTNPGITNNIIITESVNENVEGTYTVAYDVTDSAGNMATTVTRTVYVDFTAPVITIIGDASLAINVDDQFTDDGATATDTVSGNLVVTSDCSGVDTSTPGTYTCTYTATDDAGNSTTVTRSIEVLNPNITIGNVPLKLTTVQGGKTTRIVFPANGDVVVSTNIPGGGTDTFDWSASDNNLVATSGLISPTFSFDPAGLSDGIYQVKVTTNAGTADEVTSSRLLLVTSAAPTLMAVDTDGDGINDDVEGWGDDDSDGVPNFLDNANDPANSIRVTSTTSIITDTGTLELGTTAFASSDVPTGRFTAMIGKDDIVDHGGPGGSLAPSNTIDSAVTESCVGGCFDFEVSDIDPGSLVRIVLPLSQPISTDIAYRLYTADFGWAGFDTTETDEVASSAKVNGVCPAPSAANRWINGLFPGDECIRLTIKDGGPNDADFKANGVVKDPGGAGTLKVAVPDYEFKGEGCSVATGPVNLLQRTDWLVLAIFIAWLAYRNHNQRRRI